MINQGDKIDESIFAINPKLMYTNIQYKNY